MTPGIFDKIPNLKDKKINRNRMSNVRTLATEDLHKNSNLFRPTHNLASSQ